LNARTSHPLVSICIPTRNGEKWIQESIRSALSQTYPSLEILVVDDCSTDNTMASVRSFKDDRVRVVINDTKQGLAGNWNECVRQAKGEFIKFLFQDDAFYPECTDRMMQLFLAQPQLGLVFTRRDLIVETDAPAGLARELLANYTDPHLRFDNVSAVNNGRELFVQHLERRLFQSCIAEPPSTLIRKEVFRQLGLFNTRMHQACDIEMWLRIMFFYDVGFVDEKLLIFRVHGKSATASNRSTRRAEYDRFWLLEGLLDHPEIAQVYPEITAWREDLLRRYRNSLVRPTAGWRSLGAKDGWREAVKDAREMPRRIRFLREADEFQQNRLIIHPRLE
jgi:glycosyltransferase involved in cell wall biosynthesis